MQLQQIKISVCVSTSAFRILMYFLVVHFVRKQTVENKELVMVGVDWQLEKFKSPFKAVEAHGRGPLVVIRGTILRYQPAGTYPWAAYDCVCPIFFFIFNLPILINDYLWALYTFFLLVMLWVDGCKIIIRNCIVWLKTPLWVWVCMVWNVWFDLYMLLSTTVTMTKTPCLGSRLFSIDLGWQNGLVNCTDCTFNLINRFNSAISLLIRPLASRRSVA